MGFGDQVRRALAGGAQVTPRPDAGERLAALADEYRATASYRAMVRDPRAQAWAAAEARARLGPLTRGVGIR